MLASAKCCGRPATGCSPSTVRPCTHSAFGVARARPAWRTAGRLDPAVHVCLLRGQAILGRLRDGTDPLASSKGTLIGKTTSTFGLTDPVLFRRGGDGVEPLASKYLPL